MKFIIIPLCLLWCSVGAFVPSRSGINKLSSAHFMADSPVADMQSKVETFLSRFNSNDVMTSMETLKQNVMEGNLGSRGEEYVIIQVSLILCILGGGIPIIGDTVMLLLGPGLLILGAGLIVFSVLDLGDSLTPLPVPTSNGLKTSGLYAEMRHPMYAGLTSFCIGLSILTGSANRLFLTAILIYALDLKAAYEEKELIKNYPDYSRYQNTVTSRFLPMTLVKQLPWLTEE
jgi:protein-S-isoprenylcysteine O-methyltransferase Ste14